MRIGPVAPPSTLDTVKVQSTDVAPLNVPVVPDIAPLLTKDPVVVTPLQIYLHLSSV